MKTTLSEAASPPLVEGGERKTINSELWHACAGPLVSLPAIGSIVYYFPQGHVEQVAASTQKVAETHIPNYPNPPSQLLCQLHNVTLHADLETDEVYAQMTLQPVNTYNKDALLASDLGLKQGKQPTEFFCKTLTASDTSTHGGFSVPRRAAEKVFPALDYTAQPPAQELVARDLHDKLWTFRHIYRGQPKRHLLTTGWSVFVSSKRLLAGDSVLFIRDEKGQLLLGIRRANRQPTSMPLSVLSSDSMHIGVLAAAAHAAANQSPFIVFYNPRTSLSEFVVPLAKYNKALYGTQVSIGMRFRMMFETEESSVRRYMGTITGISDLDSLRWPNSQWRNLQVGWDETGAGEKQNRVSVWEIETVATPFFICPPFFRFKRPLLPGEDTEIEAPSSKLPFPWLREENDILDFQNPVSSSGLDNLMGLQQRNGISNPSVDLLRSMGSNTLQDLRGNDASKELSVSQQASQTRDIQQLGLSPLQDLQSQLLLQQIQQQMQNSQQHMPSQISLQQLQQNSLPQNIQQPAQQSQMLQKLHQQSQQKLQQQFQQSNPQQKLTPQVHQNVPLQHTENQLQQQLTQAQQNSLHLPPLQQQLLLQSLMNQQQVPLPRVDQIQQMVPNLKMSQNQTLRDLQELQTKEDLTKQPVVNGTIQQRILQMQTQQQSKMPSLTSQPLETHPQNQQILLDHHSNLNQKQLSTSEQIQNHQSSISQQQSHRSTSEHSSYSHQQSPLISNHICDVEGQLLQSLSSRTNNSCSLPPQAKSESDMTEAEVSFCSTAISNIGSQMPSVISKQICGAVSDEKTRCSRLMKSATNNTHGHAPDQISNQPVSTLISSNKETCTTELKTIPNLLSAAIEKQSVGVTTFMTAQPAQIPRSFSRVSNTLTPCWFGSATHDSDFQSDLRNSTLFGVSSESNLTDATPSTLVSKECNMVKDIQACQLSADSIVSTLSTNNDIQPQLSAASILSSHSLGVQDLPDNSDVASTVEDNNFLQRASFQQPPPPMRTYTKVYKLGSVGRSIDVTRYKNYDELRYELARMFGLEGQLEDPRKTGWQLVYVDHESDILLVGDDPWEEFVSCVRYIKILSPQEVLQMSQEGMEIINTAPMQIQNATCSDDNHMWRDPHF